jgi:tetratricopeptide (TPR) repeat protein
MGVAFLAAAAVAPAVAQSPGSSPGERALLQRYTECMSLARSNPKRALAMADSWGKQGGGLGARHCTALALFESGQQADAAARFEAIEHDMGKERPGLRAELLGQAGQAWAAAGQPAKAVAAQSRALGLKAEDADLWLDRGLSYAMSQDWVHAIADFDHALSLRADDVEILVLRAAARRGSGDLAQARTDAELALKIAPDNTDALLERGFVRLAQGDAPGARADFTRVTSLVPPDSQAGRRAAAGLQGESPASPPPVRSERPSSEKEAGEKPSGEKP